MTSQSAFGPILRTDLYAFVQKCHAVTKPHEPFEHSWHIEAICRSLQRAHAGDYQRLVINAPPRLLKSFIVSVCYPAFLLGQDPTTEMMVVSYGEVLAKILSSGTRRIMNEPFYRQLFPATVLATQTDVLLETTRGGKRFATSLGGAATGIGAHWIILDDPMNASEAHSENARATAKRQFEDTFASRLNNPATGKIVMVAQRTHEDDPSGYILSQGDAHHLKLQAQATEQAEFDIGGTLPHIVQVGDLLQPSRLPLQFLEAKKRVSASGYQAQYQQDPIPDTGNMIKRAWLKYYAVEPSRNGADLTMSIDTATKTDRSHDYSACTVWLHKDGNHYLIDCWREKLPFYALKPKVLQTVALYPGVKVLIEDQGAGTALCQELQNQGVPVIARKSRDPKPVRMSNVDDYIQGGQMWLPPQASWLGEFETELLSFPNGRHDDQVDTVSQYFAWFRERPNPSEFRCYFDDGSVTHDDISYAILSARYG